MAARLQLARAASSLSSASETCVSSAAALQQLLDSLSAAQGIENEMPDSSRSPSQSCRQPEHQQQQVRHRIRQQEDRYSAIAHHAAHHQQLITTCNAITAVQAASRRAKDSRLLDEGLQPQHHTSLTADSVQWQQRHQLSELCDYKPTSPSKDASGSGSSSTSSASQSSKAASSSGTAAVQHDSLAAALMAITNSSKAAQLTPKSIVERLDKHIVGQAVRTVLGILPDCCMGQPALCCNHILPCFLGVFGSSVDSSGDNMSLISNHMFKSASKQPF